MTIEEVDAATMRRALAKLPRRAKRPPRSDIPRAKTERMRRTKLSLKRATELGWWFSYVYGKGHEAWHHDGRRVGYENSLENVLDALWEAGER